MLARSPNKVRAVLHCDCPACPESTGYDSSGFPCVACKGAGFHELQVEEPTIDAVLAWDDGPAWDAVVSRLTIAGAELADDCGAYIADDVEHHDDGTITVTIKLIPRLVSADTARYFNQLAKGVKS